MFLTCVLVIAFACVVFLVAAITMAVAHLYYDFYHQETGHLFNDDPYFSWLFPPERDEDNNK